MAWDTHQGIFIPPRNDWTKKKNTNNKEINLCVWRKIDWTGVLTIHQQTVVDWSSEYDLVSLAKLIQRNMSLLELRFLPCPELDALLPSLETCRIEKKYINIL